MTEPMTADQLEAVKAAHQPPSAGTHCVSCGTGYPDDTEWPCEPYRLAETALAEQKRADEAEARVQRMLACPTETVEFSDGIVAEVVDQETLRAASAALDGGQPRKTFGRVAPGDCTVSLDGEQPVTKQEKT